MPKRFSWSIVALVIKLKVYKFERENNGFESSTRKIVAVIDKSFKKKRD